MSERFDADALQAAWGASRAPAGFSREARVRLIGRAANALLRGELPDDEARLFLAGGLTAWLQNGGDLLGEYWRVKSCRGSHDTPAKLWRRAAHRDEGHGGAEVVECPVSETDEEEP